MTAARARRSRKVARPQQRVARRSAPAPIRFGTSGWRGILGEEVSFPRLRVLVRAIAQWLHEEARGVRVLVGFDARFASRAMAEMVARVLLDEGIRPSLTKGCTPTPAVTHALARGRYAAGLVLTASHNPPAYHGLKLFDASGAIVSDRHTRRIEAIARARRNDDAPPRATRAPRAVALDEGYLDALERLVDRDALRAHPVTLVYDAMHGAAGGYLDVLMERMGVAVEVLRTTPDPTFGGGAPDPIAERLVELVARTRAHSGLVLGIAHDGDGDRIGVVDGRGQLQSETRVLALLVDQLASAGRISQGLAIGAATGALVERVARFHGLAVARHPIGFKALSGAMLAGHADVAGDESGGFAWAPMGPDKDGILAGALLVELVARTGEPIEKHVARLEARFGASACGRIALPRSERLERAIERWTESPPARIGRSAVVGVDLRFGLRLELRDGGFVMIRISGTEPSVRIYGEAADARQLALRLHAAGRLLTRSGR